MFVIAQMLAFMLVRGTSCAAPNHRNTPCTFSAGRIVSFKDRRAFTQQTGVKQYDIVKINGNYTGDDFDVGDQVTVKRTYVPGKNSHYEVERRTSTSLKSTIALVKRDWVTPLCRRVPQFKDNVRGWRIKDAKKVKTDWGEEPTMVTFEGFRTLPPIDSRYLVGRTMCGDTRWRNLINYKSKTTLTNVQWVKGTVTDILTLGRYEPYVVIKVEELYVKEYDYTCSMRVDAWKIYRPGHKRVEELLKEFGSGEMVNGYRVKAGHMIIS